MYDHLLSRTGIAAPAGHVLTLAITRHKARLHAEFARIRLRHGFATTESFRAAARNGGLLSDAHKDTGAIDKSGCLDLATRSQPPTSPHSSVRWARINGLSTTLEEQMQTIFSGYRRVTSLAEVTQLALEPSPPSIGEVMFVDHDVPGLVAVPRGLDLTKTAAYRQGQIILQDKASCFPALLLDVHSLDGDIMDACAAPGNKTTQMASLLQAAEKDNRKHRKIWAVEKDGHRATTLRKMVKWANADSRVSILAGHDFLQLEPQDVRWRKVTALLLDPSCTGSGITSRAEQIDLTLPRRTASVTQKPRPKRQDTRGGPRRAVKQGGSAASSTGGPAEEPDLDTTRVEALAAFQLKMLRHAFRFPGARRVVYSTCSVHAAENEEVVIKALTCAEAQEGGWRMLERHEQVKSLRDWRHRGDPAAVQQQQQQQQQTTLDQTKAQTVASSCIRCEMGGLDATIGFFVAAFVRDTSPSAPNNMSLPLPVQHASSSIGQ